jgi:hypothetical protein
MDWTGIVEWSVQDISMPNWRVLDWRVLDS